MENSARPGKADELALDSGRVATRAMLVTDFVSRKSNSLVGFVTATGAATGMALHDVGIHQRDGKAWASPPSKPRLDRDGRHMRDPAGKGLWSPIVTFATKAIRDRWSDAVVAAVRETYPEALGGEAGP